MPQPFGVFLDAGGKPVIRRSVVGFVDVLGFSNLSTSTAAGGEAQRLLERIAAAIDDSRAFVRDAFAGEEAADPSRRALKFFSDNLVFAFPVGEAADAADRAALLAIRCVQRYELKMALNGFFVRGAVTLGDVCLTDEIIFGPALVESYRLESKAAIVPRVIVTDALKEAVGRLSRGGSGTPREAGNLLCRDVDGWWFVNYLDAACGASGVDWQAVSRHKAAVLASLASTTRHDVLPKFGWACRYHNLFCHWHRADPGYSTEHRIERADEQSTMVRLGDSADLPA